MKAGRNWGRQEKISTHKYRSNQAAIKNSSHSHMKKNQEKYIKAQVGDQSDKADSYEPYTFLEYPDISQGNLNNTPEEHRNKHDSQIISIFNIMKNQ